jgi:hypothetical protein
VARQAGNAPAVPTGAGFPDLTAGQFATDELFETSLIMPEPCEFLRRRFRPARSAAHEHGRRGDECSGVWSPVCSSASRGLFELSDLAADADRARRKKS